ncbi:MAG: hypothetical protein IJE48_03875 [Clostridia bacterium]|nr:hypothetical protein [Clostridia bacterium]
MTEFFQTLYNSFGAAAESLYADLFFWVINTSISASFLVAAIVILRLVLKRAPKAIFVVLWGLVAIRLICPFTIESALSLIPSAETIPTEQFMYQEVQHDDYNLAIVDNPVYPEAVTYTTGPVDSAGMKSVVYYLAWIYGAGAMLVYAAISYFIVRRRVRISAPLRDNIRLCDGIKTPFILGIIKPHIYIPSDMSEQDTEFVIAHEKAHLSRCDHLWKPLGFLLLSFHWFNPVMWVAYILLCRDIELACDEKVIRNLGTEIKKPYSEALLNCSVPRKMIAACPLAFGEVGVKQRIKSVLNYKKPAFWIIIIAVVASVAVAVCFMTTPTGAGLETVYEGLLEENYRISVVSGKNSYNISSPAAIEEATGYLREIRISKAPISDSRSEDRASDYQILFYYNTENSEQHTAMNISDDFREIWFDNGVKPSKTYRIKNPQKLSRIFHTEMEKYIHEGYAYPDVQWDYMPMLSYTGYYYFPIRIDLDYDSVKAGCTEGQLVDFDTPYPGEQKADKVLKLDKGHNIYWCPTVGDGDAAEETEITLYVYKDLKTLCEATIKIRREPYTDNPSYSSYVANLTSESDIVMVQEETGGKIINSSELDAVVSPESLLSEKNHKEAAKEFGWHSVTFFDVQLFGDFIFAGCTCGANDLGFAVFSKSENGCKLEYTADKSNFIVRETDVYSLPYTSKDGGTYHIIFSMNKKLARVVFTGDYEKTFLVNHTPALIVADQTKEFNSRILAGDISPGFTYSYDFYDKTGKLLGDSVSSDVTVDPLTEAISNAVIAHHKKDKPDGLFRCVSISYISVNEFSGTPVEGELNHIRGCTADTIIRYAEFTFDRGELKEVNSYRKPMTFTFEVDDVNEYVLISFSEINYEEGDMPEKGHINSLSQTQECYAQAVEFYKINTDAVAEKLIEKIASAKINTDNPVDYLNACPDEEEKLIYYGEYALRYIFSEFLKGGQTDIRGRIMQKIMEGLLGGEAIKYAAENGQDYFDRWKQTVTDRRDRVGTDYITENSPKAALLLEMLG